MNLIKLSAAALVATIAVLVIVGEQLSGASADAVLNARVLPLRSPLAGRVETSGIRIGATVDAGDVVASVTDARADVVHLNDLLLARDLAAADREQAAAALAATEASMASLDARAASFRRHRIAELEARLAGARERLALIDGGRPPAAAEAGTLTAEAPVPDQDAPHRLPYLESAAREQVATREAALAAARDGVFLGDGYNDAPNAEQRLAELGPQRATQAAAVQAAQARLAALDTRIGRERELTSRGVRGDIVAPVGGRVWELDVAEGSVIERGDLVGQLLDCGSTMVTLSVTETVYDRLRIGDAAVFRPRGSDLRLDGTVTRLAGAGAQTVYRGLAIAPGQRHLERYDVMISVPGLARTPELSCAVGRTGRVFFDSRPLDWLRALFH